MDVYHKASCITCRRTLAGIRDAGRKARARDIFKNPLSEGEIMDIIAMSGRRPADFLRKRDRMYKELGLADGGHSDSQIIRLMAENPGLIMRPIIVEEGEVHIGKTDAACL